MLLHFERGFNLDADGVREGGEAHRGAGMPSGIAQYLDKQVGAAVDHARLPTERWIAVNHAEDLDGSLDPIELSQCILGRCQDLQANRPRGGVRVLDADLGVDLARGMVAGRPGAADPKHISHELMTNVVRGWFHRFRKLDSQVQQSLFRRHDSLLGAS